MLIAHLNIYGSLHISGLHDPEPRQLLVHSSGAPDTDTDTVTSTITARVQIQYVSLQIRSLFALTISSSYRLGFVFATVATGLLIENKYNVQL